MNPDELNYTPTGNVDDYYAQQGLGGISAGLIQDPVQIEQPQPTEEEEENKKPEPINDQINPETGEAYSNNPLQEIGTAVMGAGIDFAEDVGETAQRTVQGKWFDDKFEPDWLQVDDDVEPMQTTRWGEALRGVLSFGIGFVGTSGLGTLAKASKIPGLVQAGRLVASTRTTKLGSAVQGTAKGAFVTFNQASSEEGTINDAVSDVLPWFPRVFTSDDEGLNPLERRAIAVMEDIALGGLVEVLFGFRAGGKAAKKMDAGKATQSPQEAIESTTKELRANQDAAIKDQIKLDMEIDPNISKARPQIHPGYFEAPDKGIRSVGKNSTYNNLRDLFTMANRGDMAAGRRASLMTEAALSRVAKGLDTDATKWVKALKTEVEKGFDLTAGKRVGGTDFTMEQIRQLAVVRYADIMETFPDLAKADWDEVKKSLLEDSITKKTGSVTKEFMDPSAVIANEMLLTDMAAAVSDRASALITANAIPAKEGMDQLLDNVEAAMLFAQESSEFAGSLLRARAGDRKAGITTAARLATKDKKQQVSKMMQQLRKVVKTDPDMAPALLRAFAESDGEIVTLEAMRKYMTDQLFRPGALLGKKKSFFIESMFSSLYNSVLSAPKTLSRAFLGTNMLVVLRPIQIAMGGALAGDKKTMAKGAHMAFNGFNTIREAFTLSRNAQGALIDGSHISQAYKAVDDEQWKMLGMVVQNGDSNGAKYMYQLTDTIRNFNAKPWVNYPGRALAQIDIFSKTLIARQELTARAFDAAYTASDGNVTKELLRDTEKRMRDYIFNSKGEIIDDVSELAGKEVALQRPLTGKLKELDKFISSVPLLKPFFLFMKTGANALEIVQKHTPLLARFNDETRAILGATPERLDDVLQYGISDANSLKQAQALVKGRIATGYLTVGATMGLYTSGNLTGNGPEDFETKQSWIQNGWQARSIKINGQWVKYEGLEPFASFLALGADIGDWTEQLGETATENLFRKMGYLVAQNLTNKSFLSGIEPLQDILSTDMERNTVWVANLTNNFIPFAAVRNEIANVFNPGMRELEADFWQTIKNRNPGGRNSLPKKYDPLDGSLVKDWDFPTRMWNSISPINISGKDTETRRLLRESGYDLATTFKTDKYGLKLEPEQISRMQQLMGQKVNGKNLEDVLREILTDPVNKKEIEYYRKLRNDGVPGNTDTDPNNVPFEQSKVYRLMTRAFNNAKNRAQATLEKEWPELRDVGRRKQALKRAQNTRDFSTINEILLPTR